MDLGRLSFGVLPSLLEKGEAFVQELADLKLKNKEAGDASTAKRRRLAGAKGQAKRPGLKETRPWGL